MICGRCGHPNPDGANYCSSCGAPIISPEETTLTLSAVEAADLEDDLAKYLDDLPPGVGLLVLRRGPNAGSSYRLEADETTAGRHPDSDIFLDDITVSRRYASIRRTHDGFTVRDAGSLNGTYVNRERVDEARLRTGDELQIGRFRLSFVIGEARESVAPESTMARAHVSIGDVLNQLREEFPEVTISKIRFLESQGLVDPERTPSGYRKFYPGDVERLRWILREQREHFLPLKVIKERLDEIDRDGGFSESPEAKAEATEAVAALFASARTDVERTEADTVADVLADDGTGAFHLENGGAILTRSELADLAGLDDTGLAELEAYGFLKPSVTTSDRALFDEDALNIARIAQAFMKYGIEPRHLRMYRAFVEREASLFEQVLLPYRRQRNPDVRAREIETLVELAELGRRLRTTLLQQSVRQSFGS